MQDKITESKWFMAAAVVGLAVGAAVQAAPILSVDFQASTGTTQAGFVAFDANVANPSAAYSSADVDSGEITIALRTSANPAKERTSSVANLVDSETFTLSSLFRDLHSNFTDVDKASVANLIISELDANTQYDLQIWSIDPRYNKDSIYTWYDLTQDAENPVEIGQIANQENPAAAYLVSNDVSSLKIRLTSSAAGELILSHTDSEKLSGASGALNGLTISLVPEPASLGLLGLSGLLLCRRRRA